MQQEKAAEKNGGWEESLHRKVYLGQGQASGMDWTLHTDFWKSETSRDIKKNF